MVFGIKGTAAVSDNKYHMIINSWLTFPFADMTWLDSHGKYHM